MEMEKKRTLKKLSIALQCLVDKLHVRLQEQALLTVYDMSCRCVDRFHPLTIEGYIVICLWYDRKDLHFLVDQLPVP